jgi:hypothetical protein
MLSHGKLTGVSTAIIIPYRDRGKDPLRAANLERCLEWWAGFGAPVIVADDGREGDAQFNRSAAYNRGTAQTDADMLVYVESDTLIPYEQIHQAIEMAQRRLGMVVPFTHQKKLSETDSVLVRGREKEPADCIPTRHPYGENTNYGCCNVLSRRALEGIGQWDEQFEGHGHDDNGMFHAFDTVFKPVRWVDGNSYHLYHLDFDPDTTRDHSYLTKEDVLAQSRNRQRLELYRCAKSAEEIRLLTSGTPVAEWVEKHWGRLNWRIRAFIGDKNDPLVGRYTP